MAERGFVGLALLVLIVRCGVKQVDDSAPPPNYTQWNVSPAAGLDVLLLIGAVSDDAILYGSRKMDMTP